MRWKAALQVRVERGEAVLCQRQMYQLQVAGGVEEVWCALFYPTSSHLLYIHVWNIATPGVGHTGYVDCHVDFVIEWRGTGRMAGYMAKKLRIVAPRYGEEVVGGAESVARLLAEELVRRGWVVQVLTSCAVSEKTWENVYPPGSTVLHGVQVLRSQVASARDPRRFELKSRIFFRIPPALRPEYRWIKEQGPYVPTLIDEICGMNGNTAGPGHGARVPHVPTLFVPYLYYPSVIGLPAVGSVGAHSILMPAAHDELPLYLAHVGRLFRSAGAIWYATPEEKALVERTYPFTKATTSRIGTVAVEAPGPDPDKFRRKRGIQGPYLIAGGRSTPGKGIDTTLFEALTLARSRGQGNLSLVVTGEGVPEHLDGVVSVGVLSREEWWSAVAGAAAVVVPGAKESLSLVALEAWASGRPTIANRESPVLAGQTERSGGGVLFSSIPELALRMEAAVTEQTLMTHLGEAGKRYVTSNYGWKQVVANLDALISLGIADVESGQKSRQ